VETGISIVIPSYYDCYYDDPVTWRKVYQGADYQRWNDGAVSTYDGCWDDDDDGDLVSDVWVEKATE